MKSVKIPIAIATILCTTLAWGTLKAQTPRALVVSLPEEPPAIGDVLYVVELKGDTVELGYYLMHGKNLEKFPNWKAADESEGLHNRFTDMWCEIASYGKND